VKISIFEVGRKNHRFLAEDLNKKSTFFFGGSIFFRTWATDSFATSAWMIEKMSAP
jgi:hypothetical protein